MKKYDMSILFVEDDIDTREIFSDILKQKVEEVFVLDNALDAIETYKKNNIDLVIADIRMPFMDGLDMSQKLKEINPDVKIILLTGNSDSKSLLKAISLGINTYLIKPLNIKRLDNELSNYYKILSFEKEKLKNDKLLNEYKKAVDLSCIVSETDINGNIIYVNQQFEDITGYKDTELLGKSHSIISHKTTSKNLYNDLWKTIKIDKKPWNGILRNRKKDGEEFYANTFVNPILNDKNEIVKFIALRTDITQTEKAKELIINKYEKANENFEEACNLVSIYENAINQSNIIIRLNDKYEIIYLNDVFYELTKYKKDDLINKPFLNIIEDEENNPYGSKENIFNYSLKNGIWKGKLNILNKNQYVLNLVSTITSIKDKNNCLKEYLIFIQDITEIIELHKELEEAQKEIIYKLGEIVENRSKETGMHIKRVAEYSKLLALKYGLSFKESEILKYASPLHDVGKISIPDYILNKEGKLSTEEFEIMKTHTTIGFDLLKNSNINILNIASIISHEHHEKWDGTGYPRGLCGEEIHIYGRITAIADVFDALGSDRVYKKAWELKEIINLFKKERGKHFDPKLIDLFFENLDEFLYIKEKFK